MIVSSRNCSFSKPSIKAIMQLQQTYKKHILETLKLAWPVIAGQLGHIVIGQVDNYMIGDLGATELAASSLANGIFYLVMVFGFGICAAISPITSKAIGAETGVDEKSSILMSGLQIVLIISLLILVAVYGMREVLPFLGQSEKVVPMAQSFLIIIGWSIVPMLLFLVMKHFIDGFGDTIPGMLFMMLMVGINVFFNWLFIYGKWGLPVMGLDGAAWATLLSRSLGFLLFLIYMLLHPKFKLYLRLKNFFQRNAKIAKNILNIGIPSGLQYLFEIGAFSGAVILAGRIGEYEQSAHQIAISIASVTYMFYMGISAAASIRIGHAYGRKDVQHIQRAGIASLITTILFIAIFILLMLGFQNFLSRVYIDKLEVQEIVYKLIFIAVVFQLFDGIQAVVQGMLRGIEDVKIPSLLAFTAYWLIGIPAAYFLSEFLGLGIEGIWWSLTIGLSFSALFLSFRFFRMTRKMKLKNL
jgi:MATE family multidrug resistance protein